MVAAVFRYAVIFSFMILPLVRASAQSGSKSVLADPKYSEHLGAFFSGGAVSSDLAADESVKFAVSRECPAGRSARECRKARAALEAQQSKAKAVRNAVSQLSSDPNDFTPEKVKPFVGETDLLTKLETSKGKSPIIIYKHNSSPIYFIKFNSAALQEAALARIGIFVEESGQMARGTFSAAAADGNDYRLSDLARFFNKAEKENVSLNQIEERLRLALLKAGLLQKTRDEGSKQYTYIASQTAAIVSVGGDRVKASLSHELNHAVYFTDSQYRNKIAALYKNGFSNDEKKLVDKIMDDLAVTGRYNFKNDQELFLTEMAAFFRDPDELWNSYLKGLNYPESIRSDIQAIVKKVKSQETFASFYNPVIARPAVRPASGLR